MKILVVEDEIDLLNYISDFFLENKNICEVASTYFEAEDKLALYTYDIIILDITLPDGSGLDLISKIKERHAQTGILILSAKNALDDKLKGLELGADDYITKPFHLAELNARVNAMVRRNSFKGEQKVIFNEIEIDYTSREVKVNDNALNLTKKEYDLLLFFITNRERVITKEVIAEHLWGDHIDNLDNVDFIYTHIKNLRQKVVSAGGADYLKSMYGLGYKFTNE